MSAAAGVQKMALPRSNIYSLRMMRRGFLFYWSFRKRNLLQCDRVMPWQLQLLQPFVMQEEGCR